MDGALALAVPQGSGSRKSAYHPQCYLPFLHLSIPGVLYSFRVVCFMARSWSLRNAATSQTSPNAVQIWAVYIKMYAT